LQSGFIGGSKANGLSAILLDLFWSCNAFFLKQQATYSLKYFKIHDAVTASRSNFQCILPWLQATYLLKYFTIHDAETDCSRSNFPFISRTFGIKAQSKAWAAHPGRIGDTVHRKAFRN
jgi:hypothetical protein